MVLMMMVIWLVKIANACMCTLLAQLDVHSIGKDVADVYRVYDITNLPIHVDKI